VLSASLVVVFLAAMRACFPLAEEREAAQYAVVVVVGYGHLVGAALPSLRRLRGRPGLGVPLGAALLAASAFALLALYLVAAARLPLLLVAMLGLATWHTVENDVAMGHSFRRGRSLPRFPGTAQTQLVALGASALLLAIGAATLSASERAAFLADTPIAGLDHSLLRGVAYLCGVLLLCRSGPGGPRPTGLVLVAAARLLPCDWHGSAGLGFADFFAASTSYHLVSWLLFLRGRGALRRRMLQSHLPVALVAAALWGMALLEPLRELVVAPAIYLFWSVLHVFQTLLARGLGSQR